MRPPSICKISGLRTSSELLLLLLPLHRRASCDDSSRNGTGEITMHHSVIHSLHSLFDSLLNSPHHLMAYIAVAAALLVSIPLLRALFRSRGKNDDAAAPDIAYPSMLGLSSLPTSPPTSTPTSPLTGYRPAARGFTSPAVSKVTPINQSLTAPCIHCGVTMSSRQDFCPACGYAQPVKQGLKAAFPA
jgi:hypothetical protein